MYAQDKYEKTLDVPIGAFLSNISHIWKLIFTRLWRKTFLQGFDKILDQYLMITPVGDFVSGLKGHVLRLLLLLPLVQK